MRGNANVNVTAKYMRGTRNTGYAQDVKEHGQHRDGCAAKNV